jgi:hypothetical protein
MREQRAAGDADTETSADHSRRVFAALTAEKHFEPVHGVGHNGSLSPQVWDGIARWLDTVVPPE